MRITATLLLEPFDELTLARDFLATLDAGSGAVASFTGRMRGAGQAGEPLTQMVLEHHPERTAESLRAAAERVTANHPVDAITVVHRAGTVRPGEAIVWVAAAAPHRRAAIGAVDELMDRLKTEAVLWKREESAAGRHWIEPLPSDHADRARWKDQDAGTD
jgi:molybdopterin synthase catalytic subunit